MSKRYFLLSVLLLLLCFSSYSVAEEDYPVLSNRQIVEALIEISMMLDQAYQAFQGVYSTQQNMQGELLTAWGELQNTQNDLRTVLNQDLPLLTQHVSDLTDSFEIYKTQVKAQRIRDVLISSTIGIAVGILAAVIF